MPTAPSRLSKRVASPRSARLANRLERQKVLEISRERHAAAQERVAAAIKRTKTHNEIAKLADGLASAAEKVAFASKEVARAATQYMKAIESETSEVLADLSKVQGASTRLQRCALLAQVTAEMSDPTISGAVKWHLTQIISLLGEETPEAPRVKTTDQLLHEFTTFSPHAA